MSHVTLLCADRSLPLYPSCSRRTRIVRDGRTTIQVEEDGFSVQPNEYYDQAVEELGFPMKPHRYELDLRATTGDAEELHTYLEKNLCPGETVELWSVWVPRYPEDSLTRYQGRLADLDLDASAPLENWNICIAVER